MAKTTSVRCVDHGASAKRNHKAELVLVEWGLSLRERQCSCHSHGVPLHVRGGWNVLKGNRRLFVLKVDLTGHSVRQRLHEELHGEMD